MPIEFQNDAQKVCYEKVSGWLKEIFGEFVYPREDAPMFMVPLGSAYATTAVYSWGEDEATITTRSYVVQNIELTLDLMKYLLRENADMRFGAFGIDDDEDILFEHSIVGSTADKAELKSSVMAVVGVADQYDDQIVGKWGGQRASDKK